MSTEPNSGLYDFRNFVDGESGWADEMIANMLRIGRVGFCILVEDKDLQEPDSTVTYSDGDTYIVASGATGAWAGQDNNIAVWDGTESEWVFYTPREGWRVAIQDEEVDYRYAVDSGTGWVKQPTALSDGSVTIDGDLSVGGAASVVTTNGIKFPADQVDSADPNTLDDYEEGTFTAAMTAGTSGTITLNGAVETLRYTKVGDEVNVTGALSVSSVSSPIGALTITGLPFTVAALNSSEASASISVAGLNSGLGTGMVQARISTGSTSILITKQDDGEEVNIADLVKASSLFVINLTYKAA